MTKNKRLSIILPSYNDFRIERAIKSIRRFDDIGVVRIVVVDGGSSYEVKHAITNCLSSDDTFISEPDGGIFDALNKGLDASETDYIGWLGSDDMFTGKVLASRVILLLEKYDLFVANVNFFDKGYVTRTTFALPSCLGLTKFGLHNPHYGTFGSAALLKSERFNLGLRGSDIEYFIKIFNKKPRVTSLNLTVTLQEEGGFSNSSYLEILRTNYELISLFGVLGPISIVVKLGVKLSSKIYYKIFRVRLKSHFFRKLTKTKGAEK